MSNKKNILINQIDVAYRDIENIDYQYIVMKSILNNFNEKSIESYFKMVQKRLS